MWGPPPVPLVLAQRGQSIDDPRSIHDPTLARRVRDVRKSDKSLPGAQLSSEASKGDSCRSRFTSLGRSSSRDGLVMCAQRGHDGNLPGLWEFPGGKIEPGESKQDALMREITEELGCTVEVGSEVTTTTHEYDFGEVTLTTFYCRSRRRHADADRARGHQVAATRRAGHDPVGSCRHSGRRIDPGGPRLMESDLDLGRSLQPRHPVRLRREPH